MAARLVLFSHLTPGWRNSSGPKLSCLMSVSRGQTRIGQVKRDLQGHPNHFPSPMAALFEHTSKFTTINTSPQDIPGLLGSESDETDCGISSRQPWFWKLALNWPHKLPALRQMAWGSIDTTTWTFALNHLNLFNEERYLSFFLFFLKPIPPRQERKTIYFYLPQNLEHS